MFFGEIEYTFVVVKNNHKGRNKEPYLYFISDLRNAYEIVNHYLKRWKIECCFRHLKSNGFNIEDINLKSDLKIELMMGILACTYLIAIIEGTIQHHISPSKMKIYKNGTTYPVISIFRSGYIQLQCFLIHLKNIVIYISDRLKPLIYKYSTKVIPQIILQNV